MSFHFTTRSDTFPRPSNLLALKRQILLMCVKKRTKFIFTHYNNYMYYMYHRYMMFRQVHDEVQSIFIFRFGACWQIINANTACMVL